MKRILPLLFFLTATLGFAQVGVNTTTPDPSSMLDVSATNKGVLVPRVSLPNVTTTMLDGTNTAATGLLIWNTNAASVGGNGIGFYFFNGTQWMPITQSSTADHDFYEVGSTTPPDNISDNMFHLGDIAIGKNAPDTPLDIYSTGSDSSNIKNTITANTNGSEKIAIENTINGTSTDAFTVIKNNITSANNGNKNGVYNIFDTEGLIVRGIYNVFNYTQNSVNSSGYQLFGQENVFPVNTGHTNIGTKNTINTTSGNTQAGTKNTISAVNSEYIYGTFNTLTGLKPIGTINGINSTSSTPTFPGIGTDNWFNPVNPNSENIGTRNAFYGAIATTNYGAKNLFTSTSSLSEYGIYNSFSPSNSTKYGLYNIFNNTSTGDKYGVYNLINSSAGGTHYGLYSNVLKSGSYAGYFLGNVSIGTTTANNYILPASRGTIGQTMQTDGAGNVTWVNPPTDTDDQTTDVFSLTGTTLNLSLQNDGVATQTVDLSSIVGDDDWTDIGADIERQTGNVYIGDTAATNNNLYVSNQLIDWYNATYFLDPATANRVNEVQFDDGSVTDPSITFTEQNTGFFSPYTDATAYSSDGVEAFRIHSNGNIAVGQTIDPNYNLSISSLFGNSTIEIGNDDFNDNVMNIFHDGDRASALNVAALSSYSLASRSSISATNALGASAVDIARYETGVGNTFGVKSIITNNLSGSEYGIYSEALQANGYAGYFLGRTSIGTTTTNNYILPASRGTNGQTIQTDGSGNVTWVNPPTDTDDQTTDVFSLTGNTLNLSLQNDGVATQTVDLSSLKDADWYEVGGTNSPDAITDNKFTLGDISIGKITAASGKLDVDAALKNVTTSFINNNTTTGSKLGIQNSVIVDTNNNFSYGISNSISGNADFKYGIYNTLSGAVTGGTFEYGLVNNHTSSGTVNSFGVFNGFNPSALHTGFYNGIYNTVSGTNHIGGFSGVDNVAAYATNNSVIGINNSFGGSGSGGRIGVKNTLTGTSTNDVIGIDTEILAPGTGDKYGERILISNISGGTHYGVYSEATKANSYAGYFLGNVSVGTNITNNYVLPPSRGTNGQIMQTDGSGNVTWVNNSASDADWYEVGGLTPADSILDNIYTGGDVSIGKATPATAKLDIDANSKLYTLYLDNSNPTTGLKYGIVNNMTLNTNNVFSAGISNNVIGNSPFKFGVTNHFNTNNSGAAITELGYNTDFASSGNVNFTGNHNFIVPISTNTGTIIGYQNTVSNTIAGPFTGMLNTNAATTNSLKAGLINTFAGGGNGDSHGITNDFTGSSNGEYIGINTSIISTGTGFKYGEKIVIDNSSGGIHCGIYADVTKSNSYAGYFLGRVSLGTTIGNSYILPSSRGTNGQIMQTDGAGNVSWVNPGTVFTDTDNQQIDVLSLTGDTLNLSLQGDAVATQTLNLGAIDNQGTDVFSLTGNTLNLSLQNDGVATQTVDLSTLANDWKLMGNAGTASGTNFIGTTDAQDLSFRTNNVTKLTLTQRGQLSITNTGGSVLVGSGAGDADDFTTNQNTFIGTVSGESTSSGNLNSALGFNSLNANTLGLGNTAVGANALNVNVDGNNNTGLGRGANVSTTNLTNATTVGFNSTVNASNKIRLGNAVITVVEGQVAYTNPSDARFKFNVKEDVPGLDFIKKLKPVTYNFDTKKFDEHLNKNRNKDEVANEDFATSTAIIRTGFLAQDVEKICNDLGYNFDGLHIPDANNPTDNYGIAYSQFIMPIVKAVQEQQVIIENQKTELEQLKSELEKYKSLEERIKALENK